MKARHSREVVFIPARTFLKAATRIKVEILVPEDELPLQSVYWTLLHRQIRGTTVNTECCRRGAPASNRHQESRELHGSGLLKLPGPCSFCQMRMHTALAEKKGFPQKPSGKKPPLGQPLPYSLGRRDPGCTYSDLALVMNMAIPYCVEDTCRTAVMRKMYPLRRVDLAVTSLKS
jgi:hypothetical protein